MMMHGKPLDRFEAAVVFALREARRVHRERAGCDARQEGGSAP